MKPQAIILDVYRTLLWIGDLRVPTDSAWERIWQIEAGVTPPLPCAVYIRAWDDAVLLEHQRAISCGIDHPEVDGPSLVRLFLPGAERFSRDTIERVLLAIAREVRDARLSCGAADFLKQMTRQGIPLGIASNSQPYTLVEFGEALESEGLSLSIFQPDLTYWSHLHGVAKPSPFVFRALSMRLANRGIAAGRALMVGDRVDRDIEPAAAQGWQTFRLDPADPVTGWRLIASMI